MVSLRINAGAFIKFFKFLEAIYSREVFNRRCFTIPHDQPNLNLKKPLSFKRADQNMNFKHYFRGSGSTRFSKIDLWNKNISGSGKNYWFFKK